MTITVNDVIRHKPIAHKRFTIDIGLALHNLASQICRKEQRQERKHHLFRKARPVVRANKTAANLVDKSLNRNRCGLYSIDQQ